MGRGWRSNVARERQRWRGTGLKWQQRKPEMRRRKQWLPKREPRPREGQREERMGVLSLEEKGGAGRRRHNVRDHVLFWHFNNYCQAKNYYNTAKLFKNVFPLQHHCNTANNTARVLFGVAMQLWKVGLPRKKAVKKALSATDKAVVFGIGMRFQVNQVLLRSTSSIKKVGVKNEQLEKVGAPWG
eukprot:2331639-Amphidinium_carterae.1